jgi:peptidoglycan glycosyltransferase
MVSQPQGVTSIEHAIESFGLLTPPALIDFKSDTNLSYTPIDKLTDPQQQIAEATGQGKLTVTPIQMALVAATIANHGNSIQVHLADATREPNATNWEPIAIQDIQQAVITHDVADQISEAMLQAVTSGAAQAAGRAGLDIRGHASMAFTGPQAEEASWFIGFVNLPGNHALAVAAVIQDTSDTTSAPDVGGIALADSVKFTTQ